MTSVPSSLRVECGGGGSELFCHFGLALDPPNSSFSSSLGWRRRRPRMKTYFGSNLLSCASHGRRNTWENMWSDDYLEPKPGSEPRTIFLLLLHPRPCHGFAGWRWCGALPDRLDRLIPFFGVAPRLINTESQTRPSLGEPPKALPGPIIWLIFHSAVGCLILIPPGSLPESGKNFGH